MGFLLISDEQKQSIFKEKFEKQKSIYRLKSRNILGEVLDDSGALGEKPELHFFFCPHALWAILRGERMEKRKYVGLETLVERDNSGRLYEDYMTQPASNDAQNSRITYGMKRAKNIGLFLLSPVVGLAYTVGLPFYGLYRLGGVAKEAYELRKAEKIKLPTQQPPEAGEIL